MLPTQKHVSKFGFYWPVLAKNLAKNGNTDTEPSIRRNSLLFVAFALHYKFLIRNSLQIFGV
jgi:hypothetical protein